MSKPVVGVSTDVMVIDGHRFHAAGEKYLQPITAVGAIPRLLPSLGAGEQIDSLLDGLDGLLLTGAVSNIQPRHYGGRADDDCPPFDPSRDSTTLPLIRAAIERGLPLLAICRGMQELNVALGGSLNPRVHETPGRIDHRAPKGEAHEIQYAPRHSVALTQGGLLQAISGEKSEIMVNSLHWQAIDRLGHGLRVEATAPDGTIEAVSVINAKAFAIGVQWHPEWRFAQDPFSPLLFHAFRKSLQITPAS
jgi:putative glutamine amidotransferase